MKSFKEYLTEAAVKIDTSKYKGKEIDPGKKSKFTFETADGDIFTVDGKWEDAQKQAKEKGKRNTSSVVYLKSVG